MERRIAVHLLDKLVDMGLIKQAQNNQTLITFVQEQLQMALVIAKAEIRLKS